METVKNRLSQMPIPFSVCLLPWSRLFVDLLMVIICPISQITPFMSHLYSLLFLCDIFNEVHEYFQ